jgi:hypothetical protein
MSYDPDYVRNLIAARIPELSADQIIAALSPGDLDDDPEEMIPGRIVMQVMEVLDRMSDKLAVYEAKFADPEPVVLPPRLH